MKHFLKKSYPFVDSNFQVKAVGTLKCEERKFNYVAEHITALDESTTGMKSPSKCRTQSQKKNKNHVARKSSLSAEYATDFFFDSNANSVISFQFNILLQNCTFS